MKMGLRLHCQINQLRKKLKLESGFIRGELKISFNKIKPDRKIPLDYRNFQWILERREKIFIGMIFSNIKYKFIRFGSLRKIIYKKFRFFGLFSQFCRVGIRFAFYNWVKKLETIFVRA